MKKDKIVTIRFEYNGLPYISQAYKHSSTAIILPNKTVLVTSCIKITTGPRRSDEKIHMPQIFDGEDNLLPLKVLYKPGDWTQPHNIRFPIFFAQESK